MYTSLAHLGHGPHLHPLDMFAAVAIYTTIYAVAVYCGRPKKVSAGRRAALREYIYALTKKGNK